MSIDWKRVGVPQADGYDIAVMIDHVKSGTYGQKLRRQVPGSAKRIWPQSDAFFITIDDYAKPSQDFQAVAPDHPNVIQGLSLLELWPEIMPLCQHLIAFCPFTAGYMGGGHGTTCGNYGDDWGWIYVAADNAWGLAEGIVHEMNHWKLRAFGIWFEDWNDLILLNKPDELYTSPVRKDMPRPMGAVLHAQYSYIAVAEMCARMLAAEPTPTRDDCDWTALQIKRITEGQSTLREHARGTPGVGDLFLQGIDEWTTSVIERGNALLERLA